MHRRYKAILIYLLIISIVTQFLYLI